MFGIQVYLNDRILFEMAKFVMQMQVKEVEMNETPPDESWNRRSVMRHVHRVGT